jgi:[methyl-Co(III) methanol-specific corrinoid protein]:coenzyme M methyltransferase
MNIVKFTEKERLLHVLNKEKTDRPPVICTGGMMNAAIVGIMQKTGHTLPEAHTDPALMADLAQDIHEYTGFENIGLPFCMTIEAELLGSETDLGTLQCEPKIVREKYQSVESVRIDDPEGIAHSGRMKVVAEAARLVSEVQPDVPVIASLTGPVSTAASIVDPITFYKELRKKPDAASKLLDSVTDVLAKYAEALVKRGEITAIAVGDPSATGEILGPAMFEKFALRYLNKLSDAVHALGVPFIIHICGDLKSVRHLLPLLRCDALSMDAIVNLPTLKKDFPSITTMGNVSTFSLEWKDPEKIRSVTRDLVSAGVDIISPACGLSTSTRIENIRAMTNEVKNKGA